MAIRASVLVVLILFSACGAKPLSTTGSVRLWIQKPDTAISATAASLSGLTFTEVPRETSWLSTLRLDPDAFDLVFMEWNRDMYAALGETLLARPWPFLKGRIETDDFLSGLSRHNGEKELLFIPATAYLWGLFYNKSVLAANGITPPQTWAEFETALSRLQTAGVQPIALGSSFGWPSAAWLSILDIRINGMEKHRALIEGKRSFTDETMSRVYSILASWRDNRYFDPLSGQKNWPEAVADLSSGKAAFLYLNASAWPRFTDQSNIGFMPLPAISAKKDTRGELAVVQGFGLSSKAVYPEAALALALEYARQGAPGQTGDAYRIPVMKPENQTTGSDQAYIKQIQSDILAKTPSLSPTLDKLYPAQTAYDLNQIMIGFFTLDSQMGPAELGMALKRIAERKE